MEKSIVKINEFEYEKLSSILGFKCNEKLSDPSTTKNRFFYYKSNGFLIQIYRTSNVSIRIYKDSMFVNSIQTSYEPKFPKHDNYQRDEVFNIDGKYIIINDASDLAKILNKHTGLFKEYLRKDKWIKINSQPHEQS